MRFPKKVIIADKKFDVICDSGKLGAHFDYPKRQIKIGTKHKKESFDNFVHEIMEISLVERGMRYRNDKKRTIGDFCNCEVLISGNHDQFECVASDVALIIEPMLK